MLGEKGQQRIEAQWLTTKLPRYLLREYPKKWDGRKVCLFSCSELWRLGDLVAEGRPDASPGAHECLAKVEGGDFVRALSLALDRFNTASRQRGFAEYRPDAFHLDSFFNWLPGSFMDLTDELAQCGALLAVGQTSTSGTGWHWRSAYDKAEAAEKARLADLIRDIFGNPFRPVALAPDWCTSTAVALATQMYEAREFSAMPILADALQDAACDNVDVLNHGRGPGPHVRGCWVVDSVLGKE